MRRWISQNNIRLPRGAFFISALFFFNAVCIVSDNLLIIESFGEMAYNISYLTRVPGTNTLLACCCLLRPEEVNRCKYALTMRRWISQNNIRLPRGAFFISALFFFNAVCIVSDNLLIIESVGEMAYNISYLTRVPGTNTLLACCCLLRPEEVNSEY